MGKQFNITFDVYIYEFGYNPTCRILAFRTCTWNKLTPGVWTRRTKHGLANRKGDKMRFMLRHDDILGRGLQTGKWLLERLPLQTWIKISITQTMDGDGKVCVRFNLKTHTKTLL